MTLLLPLMPWRMNMDLNTQRWEEVHADESTERRAFVRTLLYDNSKLYGDLRDVNLAMLIVFIISFVFNFILFSLFVIFEGVRSVPSNHFIATLSISNVLLSGHLLIFNIILDPITGPSPFCDFVVYGGIIFCASSNLSRCAIAVDRYIFISDPLRYYQRAQSNWRAFIFGSVFILSIAIIVTPYVFVEIDHPSKKSCLPSYAEIYVGCLSFLLTVVPSIFLIVIYTRIFYWAFLQMQILRQEAKHFLRKREAWDYSKIPSPHSSVSSKQLRLYTGAAIFLTPTSPFSSIRHSFDLSDNLDQDDEVQTTIHKIIHILSGLEFLREERGSIVSTSVDKLVGTGSAQKNPGGQSTHKNAATNRSVDSQNLNKKAPSSKSFIDNRTAASIESPIRQTMGESLLSNVKNINESAKTTSSSKASTRSFSSTSGGLYGSSPIDDLWGPLYPTSGHAASHHTPRGYVPVTPQGKWMESQLRHYEVEVVRESSTTPQEMGHNLMCKLLKAEVKAAVMIMALMGSFVLCWMPYFITEMITVFNLDVVRAAERRVSISLIVLNCALDPLTYALMNPPFRAILSRSVSGLFRNYREPYNQPGNQSLKKMALKLKPKRREVSALAEKEFSSQNSGV